MDVLLQKFFEIKRWTDAIQTGVEKDIDKSLLRYLSTPEARIELYHQIRDGEYIISPPHEAKIPKDDGTFRTVYVNEGIDRIILSIVNDMLFELYPELIHPCCTSYQKGIGCGKVVQKVSKTIQNLTEPIIGVKMDLSKYFDSVPIEYIDRVFDYVENKFGKSQLISVVRTYYHTNTVIDMDKNLIEKYSSLRQGCAVAAFLADAVLFDIDKTISNMSDIYYVRYSDDILILGKNWQTAYEKFKIMLAEKNLILNPKKVEILSKDKWFKFLGFSIKDDQISLSKSRLQTFEKEIRQRTIDSNTNDMKKITHAVNHYLYKGQNDYSWATSVLPIINVQKDIQTLNAFVMDAIRASVTQKHKIGGLGYNICHNDHALMRGIGKNVTANRKKLPIIDGYLSINLMRNALLTSRSAYDALTMNI